MGRLRFELHLQLLLAVIVARDGQAEAAEQLRMGHPDNPLGLDPMALQVASSPLS